MPDGLKKAAAWLGLVSDDRYSYDERREPEAEELTEEVYVEPAEEYSTEIETTGNVTSVKRWQTPEREIAQHSGATVITPAPKTPTVSVQQQPETPRPASQPQTADISRIITVKPRTYNEARTIGEHFRDEVPVIMNLTEMEDVDAKRLVDFAAGLVFGLRGTIERVTSKVFLLSPHNVSVAAEDKERLAGSFYNQS